MNYEFINLKYGYYQEYNEGDDSMYDHCTTYRQAFKNYSGSIKDDTHYYDVNDKIPYSKNPQYGKTIVTIKYELLALLPSCIEATREHL